MRAGGSRPRTDPVPPRVLLRNRDINSGCSRAAAVAIELNSKSGIDWSSGASGAEGAAVMPKVARAAGSGSPANGLGWVGLGWENARGARGVSLPLHSPADEYHG